jgi:hypothetical protein
MVCRGRPIHAYANMVFEQVPNPRAMNMQQRLCQGLSTAKWNSIGKALPCHDRRASRKVSMYCGLGILSPRSHERATVREFPTDQGNGQQELSVIIVGACRNTLILPFESAVAFADLKHRACQAA